jgi:ATP adenylyltransferase/5',5'''-P-1,P-4-tetraphosphate phosphorylase II
MYRVTFKFIEAKGLKAGDYWVKVHPKADKKHAKQTRKIKDTTAPKWDEEIELYVATFVILLLQRRSTIPKTVLRVKLEFKAQSALF